MTKEELAYLLEVPEWKIDYTVWIVESSKILDAINYRQCMYCEKTVEYSSGVFTCEDCST